jgi:hypothetical protein
VHVQLLSLNTRDGANDFRHTSMAECRGADRMQPFPHRYGSPQSLVIYGSSSSGWPSCSTSTDVASAAHSAVSGLQIQYHDSPAGAAPAARWLLLLLMVVGLGKRAPSASSQRRALCISDPAAGGTSCQPVPRAAASVRGSLTGTLSWVRQSHNY